MIESKANITREEYDKMESWWKARGQINPNYDLLPANGIVIHDDGELLLACWCYIDKESKTIIPDWLVGNPEISIGKLLKSVYKLVEAFEELAKDAGCNVIRAFTWSKTIGNYAKRHGFEMNEKPVYHYGKLLN